MMTSERMSLWSEMARWSFIAILCGVLSLLSSAGDPSATERLLLQVSQAHGLSRSDLTIVRQTTRDYPLTRRSVQLTKIRELTGGTIYTVAADETGRMVNITSVQAAERRAYRERYGKLSPQLHRRVEQLDSSEQISVLLWLDNREQAPSTARPSPGQEPRIREQMQAFLHRIQTPVGSHIAELGGTMTYASRYAPLIAADLPADAVEALAQRADVTRIDLDPPLAPQMNVAGPTVRVEEVWSQGISGTAGITVAVVERGTVDPGSSHVDAAAYYNATYCDYSQGGACADSHDHATGVAGVIAAQSSPAGASAWQGIAPGVRLISGNTDTETFGETMDATEWALDRGAHVINLSQGSHDDAPPYTVNSIDAYYDYLVRHSYVTVIVAAGNAGAPTCDDTQDGQIYSPARGFNVIAVGGFDDGGTATWSDDVIAACSSYLDPVSSHSDREEPDVAAPGENIETLAWNDFWQDADGTSFAAPIVSGQAALLMERNGYLTFWPEAVRAVIMASAIHNIEGDSRLSERDGAGGVDLYMADTVVKNNWWETVILKESSFQSNRYDISAYLEAGERVRVAIAWDSNPSSDYTSDLLEADLDLYVFHPDGSPVSGANSASWDNSYEIVEFEATHTGDHTIRVYNSRFDGSVEYLGVAWARIAPPEITALEVSSTDSDHFYSPGLGPEGGTVYLNTAEGKGGGQTLTVEADWTTAAPQVSLNGGTAFGDTPPTDTDGADGWTMAYGVESWSGSEGNVPIHVEDGIDRSDTAYVTFQVDNSAPAAPTISSVTHPDQETWYAQDDVSLTWAAPSETSGVAGYAYALDHSDLTLPPATVETEATTLGYTDLDDGLWSFHVRAVDRVGNWGAADHHRLKIDTTAPLAPNISSPTHPDPGNCMPNDSPTFSWSVIDQMSGVAGVSYAINHASSTIPDEIAEGDVTETGYAGLAEGNWTFHVRAVDRAGNWGATAHYPICIQTNDPPTLDALPDRSTAEDTPYNDAIDLWAYATDPDSADSELSFAITNTPDPDAGVSINGNRHVDIDPAADWHGSTGVTIQVADPEGLTDSRTFQVEVEPVNDAPRLDWTGEPYYTADGLHPEVGTSSTTFAYRVQYSDVEGHAPTFVRVHIAKDGSPIAGSPFGMSCPGGDYTTGVICHCDTSGLATGTDYAYTFAAQDSAGADATPTGELDAPDVEAASPPAAPDGLNAATISQESIELSWNDNSDDEDTFRIYRRPTGTTAWTLVGIVSADVTTVQDTGLDCGAHYDYRVRAKRDSDDQYSDYSNVADAWTALCDLQPPSDLSVVPISETQMDLAWQDNSDDETAFVVERSPDGSSWADIDTLAANTESIDDAGLSCGSTYHYRVRAERSDDGATATSASASAATFDCPPANQSPTLSWTGESGYASDGLAPESGDASTAFTYRVTYTDADGDAPASVRAHIKKGGVEIDGSPFLMNHVSGSYAGGAIYSFSTSGLAAGADYAYTFEAQDVHGAAATPTASKNAPDVTGINSAPTLSWTGESGYASDGLDPESGDPFTAFTYRVTYADVDGDAPAHVRVRITKGGGEIAGSPFAMTRVGGSYAGGAIYSFSTSGLDVGADYAYTFEARDSQGNDAAPTTARDAPDVSAAAPPGAPTGLSAQAASQSRIGLTWQDNSDDESGFSVERSPDGSSWAEIATPGANAESYADAGLTCDTAYDYRVRAYRSADDQYSAASGVVSATTAACVPSPEIVFATDPVSVAVHRGSAITLPLTIYNDGNAPLTYTLRARRVALVSDDPYGSDESTGYELSIVTPTLEAMGLAYDEFYDNWTGSAPAYTDDPAFLADYSTVVWHADPTPTSSFSRLITQSERDVLADYLQQGWSLMVTGEDAIDCAEYNSGQCYDDVRLMGLTRVITGSGGYTTTYRVKNGAHQIHRGPYWTFSAGEDRSANFPYPFEALHADTGRGALPLLEWQNTHLSDLLVATELTDGGRVLLWNGDCRWAWDSWWGLKPFFENALFWTEAPWLGYPVGSETIPAGDATTLTLSLDAGPRTWVSDGPPEGEYSTVLIFQTNDPAQPWAQVPVTMSVIPNTPPVITDVVAAQCTGTGLVDIAYHVSDAQQEIVTMTLQYWDGDSWAAPTTVTGTGVITTAAHYTAIWDARADFDGHYLKSARMRVTATDGQTTHQTGSGESTAFELDTQAPTNNGPLSPADDAIDVPTTPALTARPASGDRPPLQYRFRLDDNAALDDGSGRRQDSGWLTNRSVWTPTRLLTSTTYWWQVSVRDAYSNTAAYSAPYAFTTQSAVGNHTPVLTYTAEPGYESDGLDPEAGSPVTSFAFRITYSDSDGDAPASVRVHLLKGGVEAEGSPFTLSHVEGSHTSGAIYAATVSGLAPGFDYAYDFRASDVNGAATQSGPLAGPDVSGGPPITEIFGEMEKELTDVGGYGAHIGNLIQVVTSTHVSEFAFYYKDTASQHTHWFVAQGESFPGPFTILFSRVEYTVGTFGEWRSSGEINLNLQPGQIYLFGVGFTNYYDTVTPYRSQKLGSQMPLAISFGQLLQGYYGATRGDWSWWPPWGTNTLDDTCAPEEVCGSYHMRLQTGYPGDVRQVYLPLVLRNS